METVPIPSNAIGRPGMVAMLQRVKPEVEGRTVAVRLAVGPVSSLANSAKPVFAWQVLVLGDPVEVNGKPCSEIIVADRCLKPVSQIDPSKVEELVKARARQDFDAAMADLRKILERHPMTDEQLETAINKAAEQSGISHALEVVPTVLALKDIGFRSTSPDSEDSFHWSGLHQGKELYVMAGPDMFGQIQITGRNIKPREMMWDERRLLADEPRGKVFLLVLDLWRSAFGRDAPVPDCLQLGLMYEQHLADRKQMALGLPTIYLDGEIFRATRKWIAQRHGELNDGQGPQPDKAIHVTFHYGLLSFTVDGCVYACPGKGSWVDDCQISMRQLLAMPPWHLRGYSIQLVRTMNDITLNGYDLPLLELSASG